MGEIMQERWTWGRREGREGGKKRGEEGREVGREEEWEGREGKGGKEWEEGRERGRGGRHGKKGGGVRVKEGVSRFHIFTFTAVFSLLEEIQREGGEGGTQ